MIFLNKKIKKYDVILADPPWSYYNDSDFIYNTNKKSGVYHPPYKVLSSQRIKNANVETFAKENSFLFVWSTDYHLKICLDVIKSWGFEYKTIAFFWLKLRKKSKKRVSFSGAYNLKSGVELCLLATRGKPRYLIKTFKVDSFISSERLKHSEKPEEVIKRIEQMFGFPEYNVSFLELFSRKKRDGWDVFGDQVENDVNLLI